MDQRERVLVNEEVVKKSKLWPNFIKAKLGFRNHWYPVMFAGEVEEGKPVKTTLCGENLLLNRVDGKVYVLQDKCLHRGVALSKKIECYTKDTITCWYHAWTYRWDNGSLCDIITDPESDMIGKHSIKGYTAQEAKGLVFVFLGDIEPTPLINDVPPGFLDEGRAIRGIKRELASNWRVAVENGFDSTHVFIHKDSKLIPNNKTVIPLGFATNRDEVAKGTLWTIVNDEDGPKGIYDNIGQHAVPVMEGKVHGETVLRPIIGGDKKIANQISIWMPGVLKVDPFPDPTLIQYEWYVPKDENTHWYIQTLGREVANEAEEEQFDKEFKEKWEDWGLRGFNDDDIWAREAMEEIYKDDWAWIKEQLFEPDGNIVAWRQLASEVNRGVQTLEDL